MPENERDTHFAGFAKLLQDDLNAAWRYFGENMASMSYEEYTQDIHQRIARRAYDLAAHITGHVAATTMDSALILKHVPDMTAWPEQKASK